MDLQTGRAADAVDVLTRLAGRHEKDGALQRLLAQALMANGQLQEAVQAFETARAIDPKDPELAFLLGSAYLQVKKLDEAERLFAEVIKARPGPETDVLLGRTYRDAAQYDRARVVLRRALKADPKSPACALLPWDDSDPRGGGLRSSTKRLVSSRRSCSRRRGTY